VKNEKDVKHKVKAILDRFDYFWFMPPANGFGKAGISDFIALKNGCFLAIETKFGSNKPTAPQIGFLNSIRAAEGFAFVVNDKNYEWLEAFLDSFEKATASQRKKLDVAHEDGARMLNAIAELSNKFLDV
jgi:hypothetical protein